MKRLIILVITIFSLLPAIAMAAFIEPARIRHIEGDLLLRTPDSDNWQQAVINTPVDEGDSIWLPQGSKGEVELSDGTMIRLQGGSELNFLANERDYFHLNLVAGALYLNRSSRVKDTVLQIDADDTTVLPDAGTRLRLDMEPGGAEEVSIFRGAAYVEGSGGRTRVRAGEHLSFEGIHSEILAFNKPDSWELWNRDRDRLLGSRSDADSPLPDELRPYLPELNANGRWVSSAEYGLVWMPTTIPSADWAPYSSGRWIWRGNDYIWIGAESWGWAPYHYGRWIMSAGFGWCWVPPAKGDVFWAPAYVAWYNSNSHVAWTPLAPGEIFFGFGYFGRNSVNISVTTGRQETPVHRNREHRGGLIHLPRQEFAGGTSVRPGRGAFSTSGSLSFGRPQIRPSAAVSTAIIRSQPSEGKTDSGRNQSGRFDSRQFRDRFPRVNTGSGIIRVEPVPQSPGTAATQPARYPLKPHVDKHQQGEEKKPVAEGVRQGGQQRDDQRLNPQVTVRQPITQIGGRQAEQKRKNAGERRIWRVRTVDGQKEKPESKSGGKTDK